MNDVLTISYAGTVEEQLDQTVRSTRDKLLRFIRARVSDIEDAEDILQDVFYQFVAASDPEEPIGQASSWLYKVAKNKITDWYRKKKPQYFSKFALDPGADEIAELRDEASPSPEQRV